MSEQVFYETTLSLAPIANERGGKVLRYIIAVLTHDPDGKPFDNHIGRAKEAFNLAVPDRVAFQHVDLTQIDAKDVPKDKLEQILLRHDSMVYLVKYE
jgi:hypothetical protein